MSECLEHDHRLVDTILRDVETFAQTGDAEVASAYFALLKWRLEAHIEAEETLLFPVFELASKNQGPTSVMRREHRDIRYLLRASSNALASKATLPSALSLLDELVHLLDSHNEKEERILYPAIDASVTTNAELAELVARLEAFLARAAERLPSQA